MGNKKHYMVLDTETASTSRVPFDIAYTIIDRKGNVVEAANYLVDEVFNSPLGKHLVSLDDFSRTKSEFYFTHAAQHAEMVQPIATIQKRLRAAVKKYNCVVVAYNAEFDYKALNNFGASLGCGESFFTEETKIWDLWNIALYTLCDSSRYVKFANEYEFKSEKGNLKSSAEVVYRYISKDPSFIEAHTALADTEIEAAILAACLKRHKKLQTNFVGQAFRHPVWKSRLKAV